MELVLLILTVYLAAGFGFALASWLQAAEKEVNETGKYTSLFCSMFGAFIWVWPFIALYCYRAEVKRTIKPMEFKKEREK